ncbi:endonuclease [Candidatus Kaiserbacteria bacterium]|nr:MAG: endonuclease [Candidatus Kaiserbacteria bacterium]
MYFLYIMRCEDDSLYTGITTDVERRFNEHSSGKGGHYTRAHKVEEVVYTEECENRSEAQKREAEVKKLSKVEKLSLIARP